jgi:hypothetical protein
VDDNNNNDNNNDSNMAYHQCHAEAMLSLRHLARISRAINTSFAQQVVMSIGYVTNVKWIRLAQQLWKQYWNKVIS